MFQIKYTRDPADDIVLEDPRWEAPSLLIPGKKPTGPVVVDLDHPLAAGITSFVMPVGQGILQNVLTGETITCDYEAGEYQPIQHYGLGVNVAATLDSWKVTTAAEVNKALRGLHKMQDDGLGTLLLHWYKTSGDGGDTYPYIFSARDGSAGQRCYLFSTNTGHNRYSWNDYDINTYGTMSDNTLYTHGLAVDSSNEYLYVNGELKNQRAGGGSISRATNLGLLGQAFGSPAADDNDVFGGFLFYATWSRKLTAKEQTQIHQNPYQLLIPA